MDNSERRAKDARQIRGLGHRDGEPLEQPYLKGLAGDAYAEFSDVSDYIWKSTRLVESELTAEREKLDTYFPFVGEPEKDARNAVLRQSRWQHEERRLVHVFPYMIANGNLLMAVSLFESFCIRLARYAEDNLGFRVGEARGQGLSKLFNFFEISGAGVRSLPLYEQADAALEIRNCISHASGVLDWSRSRTKLLHIVENQKYWDPNLRKRVKRARGSEHRSDVVIVDSAMGRRLEITNEYSHYAATVFRAFFANMSESIDQIIDKRS